MAREVVEKGKPALREIAETFGEDTLLEDGSLNRKKLGSMIFSDEKKRLKLNEITHPRILEAINDQIEKCKSKNCTDLIVLDCALLFEMNMDNMVDESWLVSLKKETQVKRIMARDELSKTDAELRINAQMSLEEKSSKATRIIDNSSAVNETHKQVMDLWNKAVREERLKKVALKVESGILHSPLLMEILIRTSLKYYQLDIIPLIH